MTSPRRSWRSSWRSRRRLACSRSLATSATWAAGSTRPSLPTRTSGRSTSTKTPATGPSRSTRNSQSMRYDKKKAGKTRPDLLQVESPQFPTEIRMGVKKKEVVFFRAWYDFFQSLHWKEWPLKIKKSYFEEIAHDFKLALRKSFLLLLTPNQPQLI